MVWLPNLRGVAHQLVDALVASEMTRLAFRAGRERPRALALLRVLLSDEDFVV